MFIESLGSDPRFFFTTVVAVVLSIVLHELAHGAAAIRLGDRTPIETGHMTPNPVVHMGWFSLALLAAAGIAWGQMPVNESRMRGRHAGALVALAGPLTNLVLAAIFLTALGLVARHDPSFLALRLPRWPGLPYTLYLFGLLNLVLFLFNLIPVPPLDGSRVVASFSPGYRRLMYESGGQTLRLILFLGVFWSAKYLFAFGDDAAQRYLLLFLPHGL